MERYCPYCRSHKPMVKIGFLYYPHNKRKQRWLCRSANCGRTTINPNVDK